MEEGRPEAEETRPEAEGHLVDCHLEGHHHIGVSPWVKGGRSVQSAVVEQSQCHRRNEQSAWQCSQVAIGKASGLEEASWPTGRSLALAVA